MRRITALVVAGLTLSLLTSVFAASAKENLPESLTGKVVSVADGDTISILVDRTQHRIRLDGIDCPERGQPFGTPGQAGHRRPPLRQTSYRAGHG